MSAQPLQRIRSAAAPGTLDDPVYSGPPTDLPAKPTPGQRKKDAVDVCAPNIVIYGESGVGRSSIINLIAGQELVRSSNNALKRLFQHQRYIIELDGMRCALWDTLGLDDGSEGTLFAALAESHLGSLIQELTNTGGIRLVVYCIRAARLTWTFQRNYDLFYVTVCRRKVPVALVVVGLEHQEGEMETWWAANEAVLRQYGMWFDAHACVTTLNMDHHPIQQRRLHSQRILRELVVRYSTLPAWKVGPSFLSTVLPMFRAALRRMTATGRTENSTAIRRVITCDMMSASNTFTSVSIELSSDTPVEGTRTEYVQIEGRPYEFVHVDRHTLWMHIPQVQHAGPMGMGSSTGALVFYASSWGDAGIPPEEIEMVEAFYEIAGGQTCPMVVVLRGCDNEEQATREYQNALASRPKSIQACFTTFSSQTLTDMIARLCIEHVETKTPTIRRVYVDTKQWLVAAPEAIVSVVYAYLRRRRGKVTGLTA